MAVPKFHLKKISADLSMLENMLSMFSILFISSFNLSML